MSCNECKYNRKEWVQGNTYKTGCNGECGAIYRDMNTPIFKEDNANSKIEVS